MCSFHQQGMEKFPRSDVYVVMYSSAGFKMDRTQCSQTVQECCVCNGMLAVHA